MTRGLRLMVAITVVVVVVLAVIAVVDTATVRPFLLVVPVTALVGMALVAGAGRSSR